MSPGQDILRDHMHITFVEDTGITVLFYYQSLWISYCAQCINSVLPCIPVQGLVLPAISGIYLGILECNPLDTGVGDYYAIFYVASPLSYKIDPVHVDQQDWGYHAEIAEFLCT